MRDTWAFFSAGRGNETGGFKIFEPYHLAFFKIWMWRRKNLKEFGKI
jgi:hypothetical protein